MSGHQRSTPSVSGPARALGARHLGDGGAVVLAAVTAFGAWRSVPLPLWPPVIVVVVALVARRPFLMIVGVGLLASALGARSWAGDRPLPAGRFDGRGTLVSDPQRFGGAVQAELRARGHRVDVWARGAAATVLAERAAGERIDVRGSVTPRAPGDDWAARRHLVGRVDADTLTPAGPGDPFAQSANAVRRVLVRGAASLAPDRRALFTGFVLGDARDESPVIADDFRGAGLTHLLVVSGENVAFVLVVALPVLRRLGARSRWTATIGLLGFFALLTRFEPSVLRATAMAALAVTAWTLGRPASGLRLLALAVTGLVLIDPMLVGVLGFQLSVAASAGIIVLARPLSDHLPLPRWVAAPLAVTLAAQLAVGPFLIAQAGGMPVASVPANLLAEPAAALIMAWGMTAGLVAGWLPARLAAILHIPTDRLLWWVQTVARVSAGSGLGELTAPRLAVLVAIAGVAVVAVRRGQVGLARVTWLVVAFVAVGPAIIGGSTPAVRTDLPGLGTAWRSSVEGRSVVVVVMSAGARAPDALQSLRRADIGHVDLLVSPSAGPTAVALVTTLRHRVVVDTVWLPRADGGSAGRSGRPASAVVAGSEVPEPGRTVVVGTLRVEVVAVAPRLDVRVAAAPEAALGGGVG